MRTPGGVGRQKSRGRSEDAEGAEGDAGRLEHRVPDERVRRAQRRVDERAEREGRDQAGESHQVAKRLRDVRAQAQLDGTRRLAEKSAAHAPTSGITALAV